MLLLLEMRTPREATAEDALQWGERLVEMGELDDVWIVGGDRLDRLALPALASRIVVRDPYDLGDRRLSLEVRASGRATRKVDLDLPNDAVCTRLLRDPFKEARGKDLAVEHYYMPGSNLLFDLSGVKLLARARYGGGVISYPVPNSPRAGVGRPRAMASRYASTIAAAGRFNRSTVLATSRDGSTVELYVAQGRLADLVGVYGVVDGVPFAPPATTAPLELVVPDPECDAKAPGALVIDAARNLFRLSRSESSRYECGELRVGTATRIGSHVCLLSRHYTRTFYVGWPPGHEAPAIVLLGQTVSIVPLPFQGIVTGAYAANPGKFDHPAFGVVAAQYPNGRLGIFSAQEPWEITLPNGARAMGVVSASYDSPPAILAVGPDQHSLVLYRQDGGEECLALSDRAILQATASQAAARIAYVLDTGEIVVYSMPHKAELCRFHLGKA